MFLTAFCEAITIWLFPSFSRANETVVTEPLAYPFETIVNLLLSHGNIFGTGMHLSVVRIWCNLCILTRFRYVVYMDIEQCWSQDRPLGDSKRKILKFSSRVLTYNILRSSWKVALKPLECVLFHSIRFKFGAQDVVLNAIKPFLKSRRTQTDLRSLSTVNFHESNTLSKATVVEGISDIPLLGEFFLIWDQ